MHAIKPGNYLHVKQAAELSGLSVHQVTRLFDHGIVGGFRLPTLNRARRIDPASLRAYLRESGLPTVALDVALECARRAAS